VVSFTHRPLYPEERGPCTHCIGGWVNPRASLDDVEKRKFLILLGLELRPLGCPARSQSLYRLRYPGSTALQYRYEFVLGVHKLKSRIHQTRTRYKWKPAVVKSVVDHGLLYIHFTRMSESYQLFSGFQAASSSVCMLRTTPT
jgi:hypothetical protein